MVRVSGGLYDDEYYHLDKEKNEYETEVPIIFDELKKISDQKYIIDTRYWSSDRWQLKYSKKDMDIRQQDNYEIRISELERHLSALLRIEPLAISENAHTSADTQGSDADVLNQRLRDLQQRVAKLERLSGEQMLSKLGISIKKIFAKIPAIRNVYVEPIQSGFLLTIVYASKIISDVAIQIQPGLAELEDAIPDAYFSPRLLHIDKIQEVDVQQSTLIF